jgi:hypothetical protein
MISTSFITLFTTADKTHGRFITLNGHDYGCILAAGTSGLRAGYKQNAT